VPLPHADDLDVDVRAFDRLREVLEGRWRPRLDGTSSKTLRVVLGAREADASITPERFIIHFGAQKQRSPSSYYRRLAPGVVSEILERASIDSVAGPLVIGLPAGEVPSMGTFFEWAYGPKLVWIVPAERSVKVVVRASPERWRAPFTRPVPGEGPLALRELPEWAPKEPAYRDFAPPLSCPRCGAPSTRYRSLEDALVCGACGRSFEHSS
jgi:hypothetical protein